LWNRVRRPVTDQQQDAGHGVREIVWYAMPCFAKSSRGNSPPYRSPTTDVTRYAFKSAA